MTDRPFDPPASSARQAREALGARLRELRRGAGLTARQLAVATGQHFTRVSKIEHGVQTPTDDDVREWCRACDAVSLVPDLIATVRAVESAYVEFRRQSRTGMRQVLGPHTVPRYERTTRFRIYEHNVVPGLFQTPEYMAAMLSFWIRFLETPDDLAPAVAGRVARQRVLHQWGRTFSVVLEEQALRTMFGTADVQLGQLDRLLAVASLPNVSLGIVPLLRPRSGVPSAGFWIFDHDLVALETPSAAIEVTRPAEIELYDRMFDHLTRSAVHGKDAIAIITRAQADLRNLSQQA